MFIVDWVRECEKSSNSPPEQPREHSRLPANRRDAGEAGGARTTTLCWFVGTQPYEPRGFGRTVGQLPDTSKWLAMILSSGEGDFLPCAE